MESEELVTAVRAATPLTASAPPSNPNFTEEYSDLEHSYPGTTAISTIVLKSGPIQLVVGLLQVRYFFFFIYFYI